jgi:hypothetical protein
MAADLDLLARRLDAKQAELRATHQRLTGLTSRSSDLSTTA